jgi:ATP-dependent helicase/nuclease subunit B
MATTTPNFLQRVAQKLVDQQNSDLRKCLVIVPGHRSTIYLKKHLGKLLGRTVWPPRFMTISDLFAEMSPHKLLASERAPFLLYAAYKKSTPDVEPFDAFWKWARTALADYNDIDNYLVDGKQLYQNLSDIKGIEEWSFEGDGLSDDQEFFLEFWEMLGRLYHQFQKDCLASNEVYSGLLKREVLENDRWQGITEKWDQVHIVGFNALAPTEEALFKRMSAADNVSVHWDADGSYIKKDWHEAGHFLRRLEKNFPEIGEIPETFGVRKPKIRVLQCTGDTSLSKTSAALLNDIPVDEQDQAALVLCDSSLLVGTLSALDTRLDKVNVTMGYPTTNNAVYQFFQTYIDLADMAHMNGNSLPISLFSRLLKNPLFKLLEKEFEVHVREATETKTKKIFTGGIQDKLIHKNAPRIRKNNWLELRTNQEIHRGLDLLFETELTIPALILQLQDLVRVFRESEALDRWNTEFLFHISKALNKLGLLLEEFPLITRIKTIKDLFSTMVGQQEMSFIGEPLEGLQIMGMLETRTLDFKHIILTGANEGKLPASSNNQSFIPYDLRKLFKLPTHHDQEAIYAYYFYRLLHQVDEITILYSTQKDTFGSGEKSHFIDQMNIDFGYGPESEEVVLTPSPTNTVSEFSMQTSPTIQASLKRSLGRISPSKINSFFDCPLDFYYRYVLNLGEPDSLEDSIGHADLGTIIHQVLEDSYAALDKAFFTEEALKKLLVSVAKITFDEFKNKFGISGFETGLNHLAYHVSVGYAKKIIAWDLKQVKAGNKIRIIDLEKELSEDLDLQVFGKKFTTRMGGFVDRIDEYNGQIRIIDYKTGKADDTKIHLSKEFGSILSGKKPHAIQLLYYSLLYANENPGCLPLQAGIVSPRNISKGVHTFQFNGEKAIDQNILDQYKEHLGLALESMLDPDLCFQHNSKANYCQFCEK